MMSAKEHKKLTTKRVIVDRISGRPLMTIQLFITLMLRYKILTQPEAMYALNTGILPPDIMTRILKVIDKTRDN